MEDRIKKKKQLIMWFVHTSGNITHHELVFTPDKSMDVPILYSVYPSVHSE